MEKSREHFYDLVSKFSDAMLISHSLSSQFHARPMRIVKVEHDSGIYFFTSISAPKVDEVKTDDLVCLTMQSGSIFISVSGTASVCSDRSKIQEFWSEAYRPWFPKGADAQELCLLKVIPQKGEYWDVSSIMDKLSFAFEVGKAYITGEKANVHDHTSTAKVELSAK